MQKNWDQLQSFVNTKAVQSSLKVQDAKIYTELTYYDNLHSKKRDSLPSIRIKQLAR